MKKVGLIAVAVACLCGCQDMRKEMSHFKSSTFGLNRSVTLYAADGKVIRQWDVKTSIEDQGGTVRFLTNDGKAIVVAGTFIVEEK